MESSELRKNGFDMIAYNRKDRKGDGIAIVLKENYKVKQKVGKYLRTCQYAIWSVMIEKLHLNILGLYHPPNSKVNKYSNGFLDFISNLI